MDLPVLAAIALISLVVGSVLTYVLLKGRHLAEKEGAVAVARGELQAALATATARAEQGERLANERLDELLQARTALDQTKSDLDAARDEVSRFQERSSRIPGLEEQAAQAQRDFKKLSEELGDAREKLGKTESSLAASTSALLSSQTETERLGDLLSNRDQTIADLRVDVESARQQLKAEQEAATEKLRVLSDAQDALKDQFKVLASEILDSSSKRLQEQNQTNLSTLLDPLKQKLTDFQKKVEDVYVDESKERFALKSQVENLVRLNQSLSEDAKNLTSALRGSAKSQGNWGELILERVLEASGLRKGEEYLIQDSQTNEHGQRFQPDVVINLPEERKIVVDSKVSLVAYERFASEEGQEERNAALRDHLASVRAHMRGLSEKRYQNLYGHSLDFVLMFVPIEPAFMTAVTHDSQLFMDAWERNVLLVSPSTLLFVVRTVAHLWRQEAQSKNAQEIAKRGAELYDKLTNFVADLDSVGNRLEDAQKSFGEAKKKLVSGRGNVIRQAQMLHELGVKSTKQLPRLLVEESMESDNRADLDMTFVVEENSGTPGQSSLSPSV